MAYKVFKYFVFGRKISAVLVIELRRIDLSHSAMVIIAAYID